MEANRVKGALGLLNEIFRAPPSPIGLLSLGCTLPAVLLQTSPPWPCG